MTKTEAHCRKGRADWAAAGITILGFSVRLWAASGTFLNPDEALHFRLANQLSWAAAYRESMTASHPPLLTFILYYWRGLGTSELWLRMPAVIAGVVFCWVFYKWLRQAAGEVAGLVGLLLVAFLPPVILIATEIRQYALVMMFLICAVYFLDRAFANLSSGQICASAVFLYLAMLSHYSAFLFAVALGVYALERIAEQPPPARFVMAWIGGQFAGLALALFLYKTHLAKLGAGDSRSVLQGWMSEFYLNRSYFERGRDNPLLFVIGHSFGAFQFVFGQLALGDAAGVLFLAGIVFLMRKKWRTHVPQWRSLAVLMVLPFACVCGASLAHIYPYGGTRHSAILVIPALAGVSIAIAQVAKQKLKTAISAALLIVLISGAFGKHRQPYIERADQRRAHMAEAIKFLEQNVRTPSFVFTDYESELMLAHYLCEQKPVVPESSSEDFEIISCGGIRVVSASYKAATLFDLQNFSSSLARLQQENSIAPGVTIWVVQAGWKVDLAEQLSKAPSRFRDLQLQSFGANIRVFPLETAPRLPKRS